MRPSIQALLCGIGLFVFAVASAWFSSLTPYFLLTASFFGVFMLIDFLCHCAPVRFSGERILNSRLALGEHTPVTLKLKNEGRFTRRVRVYDSYPATFTSSDFPISESVQSFGEFTFSYHVKPQKRGDHAFEKTFIEVSSWMRLWWRTKRICTEQSVQVYPNYKPALTYGLLATSNKVAQMGIKKRHLRGLSREFRQLRDYQEGDSVATIDWKATSRTNRLISREYQEEKDQNILLVTDTSLNTKVIDGDLPILDHLLNAVLLVSYIALKQGDKVSVMNFGGQERYLSQVKGKTGLGKVLDHLYNYESHDNYGEYEELVSRIQSMRLKRSLIIILTNQRSEDQYSISSALKNLSSQNLVLVAAIKEQSIDQIINSEIESEDAAASYLGALAYEQDLTKMYQEMAKNNIQVLRSSIDEFSVKLANRFLDLKLKL